jgi:UDP-N-acetylglucosamine--N-acetylmuramyl-(pentapeptide) pyrophosphoryl-undecaprenol N-acetylglucosamine transferase
LILTVLATDEHPFERALDAIEPLRATHGLVVQHGHAPARHWQDVRWLDFTPYEMLMSLMPEADAIVCHAGVGTIMTILSLGRRVVIARLAAHGEHVDDHQLQIVAKLTERGYLVPVESGVEIVAAIDESNSASVQWEQDSRLAQAVVSAVDRADAA